MDIKVLKQFAAVVRTGSVSAAAGDLGLTQPAVSMGIKRFEVELGFKVLEKDGTGVKATESGEKLLPAVERVLTEFEKLESAVTQIKNEKKDLTVAFCDRGPEWFLVPRFRLLVAESQGFEVRTHKEVDTAEAEKLLRSRTADIVVTEHPIEAADIVCEFLVRDIHYLSVPANHPLANEKEICLADAGALQVLFYQLDGAFSLKFSKFLKEVTTNVDLQVEQDYFVFQERLRRMQALTFTTALVRHYRFDGPQRDDIPMTDSGSDIGYWISYRKDRIAQSAHTKAFIKFAKDLVRTSGLDTTPNLF